MSVPIEAPCALIVWLRQVRRSSWILITLCLIFRVGDAIVPEQLVLMPPAPAVAEG